MYCLIAAESGAAEIIRDNLQKRHTDWRFEIATDAERLFLCAGDRPDVVLVSRFLIGDSILQRLPVEFPSSHIVLLTGDVNEQMKTYVRQAKKYGLTNVVTGKLPGDRPYTIFEALIEARREMLNICLEWDEEGATEEELVERESAEIVVQLEPDSEKIADISHPAIKTSYSAAKPEYHDREPAETPRTDTSHPAIERCNYTDLYWQKRPARNLILVAANKGGVGKTTVAISLSLALARAGMPLCLTDFDFGGPNVAVFFNVRNKPGIEALAGKKYVDRFLPDLLVNVEKNLVILPGPMDKTLPYFEPAQMAEIVDVLSEKYLVIGDTPPEFWTKPWLEDLFPRANLVLAVADQSKFSEAETKDYAPKLILMGTDPSRIRIVCNRFNSKLHSVKKVEAFFNAGIKVKKDLPRVISVIPEGWEDFAKAGYKGEIAGINDPHSPWQKLATEVAKDLGFSSRLSVSHVLQKKSILDMLRGN